MATEVAEQTVKSPARAVTEARFQRIIDYWTLEGAIGGSGGAGKKMAGKLTAEIEDYAAELAQEIAEDLQAAMEQFASIEAELKDLPA